MSEEWPVTAAEWAKFMARPINERLLVFDEEAEKISGASVSDLRKLQTAGAIKADKIPKTGGGYVRVWGKNSIIISAIAKQIDENSILGIIESGEIAASIKDSLFLKIIEESISQKKSYNIENDAQNDWAICIYDIIFVKIEKISTRENYDICISILDEIIQIENDEQRNQMRKAEINYSAMIRLNISGTIREVHKKFELLA
ncbi:hypothetical protein M2352_000332 [Azospirillum fermentarium]|uniref:hypothetical protein n=1 Tax=Azospirillum fermentarium TaxID=1233114 RepID=UPI0022279D5B|nr:hypothetical protein [Azospirillum fermentarium]MCW2244741.1 hypothetical protein [Azospirillum fermentarium]